MSERRGIDLRANYGLVRAICLKYFGKAADTASIEADDFVNQTLLALHVRNSGKCPYKSKPGYGPKPYIYRVAWQTLGRMARKRRRWYNVALHDDHGMLCQIAAQQGYSEIGSDHPLGRLADEAKAERKRMAAAKKRSKQPDDVPRFELFDPWALLALARTISADAKRNGKFWHLRQGVSMGDIEATLCDRLNAYQRGEWLADDGNENLAHVMASAMWLLGMRRKMEAGK